MNGRQPTPEELRAYWANLAAQQQQAAFMQQQQRGMLPGSMMPQPPPWGHFPFPTGEATVPPAGWQQQPERPLEQHRKETSTIRWGDTANIEIMRDALAGAKGASGYVLDCQLHRPAICLVRLSVATDAITAVSAQWLCTWSLTIGVGSSAQVKQRQVQIAPVTDPTVDTDIVLTWPLQLLRVKADIDIGAGAAGLITVNATAHVAPFTNFEGMVR